MHGNLLQKQTLLKKCGPRIWFCLITFRCKQLKQLNSLTTIEEFSCFGGREITHQTAVPEVLVSIPRFDKKFY